MGKRGITSVLFVTVTAIVLCGCSDSHTATSSSAIAQKSGLHLVAAPQMLFSKCRATARVVGYAVPCPTFIPAGLAIGSSTISPGCLDVIGPGGQPACGAAGRSWRGWVVGTSNVGAQHLAITASPRPLQNYAKLVNGPAWYPRARVQLLSALLAVGIRG